MKNNLKRHSKNCIFPTKNHSILHYINKSNSLQIMMRQNLLGLKIRLKKFKKNKKKFFQLMNYLHYFILEFQITSPKIMKIH